MRRIDRDKKIRERKRREREREEEKRKIISGWDRYNYMRREMRLKEMREGGKE